MIGRTRAERKVSAALRAKKALEHAWHRIDYTEDVIKPTLADIRAIEKTSEVELTESDLVSLLTTGNLPLEASSGDSET